MAETTEQQVNAQGESSEEISLEDIDKILHEDDPSFVQDLDAVKEAAEETDVEIESMELDEASLADEEKPSRWESLCERFPLLAKLSKPLGWLNTRRQRLWLRLRNMTLLRLSQWATWLKTQPKEYAKYLGVQTKALFKALGRGLLAFKAWSWTKKSLFFFLLILFLGGGVLLKMSLHGRWLPKIDKSLVKDMAEIADRIVPMEEEDFVPLHQALRQPEHRYLFDKVVVNLKRVFANENPMGLFEFYVELDSKDAAVEVKSREKELLDLLQRTLEEETYNSLKGEPGKARVKTLIRQRLNEVLNQGWVKAVYISNIVLKP